MAGLLSIALTGINAAQAGLTTTSHNISNANVSGYTRQQIVQGTQDPVFYGSGFYGQGTRVDTVKRIYSQFLDNQVLAANSSKVQYETYSNQIAQIDNLLGDETSGVAPALQNFFSAVDDVSTTPSNISSRQALISSAQSLAERFQSVSTRLEQIRDGVDGEIAASAESISGFAKQIADLNHKIVVAQSAGPGVPANDLIDERNRVISQLNEQVKVSTQTESNGSVSVFIGTGQPLVVGTNYFQMTAGPSSTDARRTALSLGTSGGASIELSEDLITGGKLAGLLTFRSDALDSAENALGRIAVGVTETFNAQHKLGQDLNGDLGGNFFAPSKVTVQGLPVGGTPITATLNASITDVNALTTSDYLLRYDGTNYSVSKVPGDGTATAVASFPAVIDGVTLSLSGTMKAGEAFLIQPTRYAAADFKLDGNISDPRKIAAALPFKMAASTSNTGTGSISAGVVNNAASLSASQPHIPDLTVTYYADLSVLGGGLSGSGFDVQGPSGSLGTFSYNPTTDSSGKTFTLTSPAISFKMSGAPSNLDQFSLGTNGTKTSSGAYLPGVSDNTNALALGNLQLAKTLNGASYETAYAQLVADVGIKANSANANLSAQDALLSQATAAQQAVSGVNLDEEAANLLRYQQAYQASARVLNVASSLFNDILSIMR